MGKLFQRIEVEDTEHGAANIVRVMPADEYNYAHSHQIEVARAAANMRGAPLTLSFFTLGVRPEFAPGSEEQWKHFIYNLMWQDCEDNDLWLYYKDGTVARWPWNGNPHMVAWHNMTDPVRNWWVHALCEFGGERYWLDLAFMVLQDYMLVNHVLSDLRDYSPPAYMSGLKRFIDALAEASRLRFVNGSFDWATYGIPTMFENMDRPEHQSEMWRWTAEAAAFPEKHVLSFEGPIRGAGMAVAPLWSRSNMTAEFKDPGLRIVARSMNK